MSTRWKKVEEKVPWTPCIGWTRDIAGWIVWLRLADSKWLISLLDNKKHGLDWTIRHWLHARKTSANSAVKTEATKAIRELQRVFKEEQT